MSGTACLGWPPLKALGPCRATHVSARLVLDNVVQSVPKCSATQCSHTCATSKGERKRDKVGISDKWSCTAGVWMEWNKDNKNDRILFSHALMAAYGRHSLACGYCRVNCLLSKKKEVTAVKGYIELSYRPEGNVFDDGACKKHWVYQLILQMCTFFTHSRFLFNSTCLLVFKQI